MNQYVIYGIHHVETPDHIVYSGQTRVGLEKRRSGHLSAARTGSSLPSAEWIRRNGESVCFKVLETAECATDLNELEIFWIAHLKQLGQAELNILPGGSNHPRDWVPTEELKKRWSEQRRHGGIGTSRISTEDVLEIRKLSAQGIPDREIASLFEIGFQGVGHILRAESWSYVPWEDGTSPRKNPAAPKIPESTWHRICQHLANGGSVSEASEKYGVSRSAISRYVRGSEIRTKYGLDDPRVKESRRRSKYLLTSRALEGSKSPEAGMSEEVVLKVKLLLWQGYSQKDISSHFGISRAAVNLLSSDRSWRHVPWPIGPKRNPKGKKKVWTKDASI